MVNMSSTDTRVQQWGTDRDKDRDRHIKSHCSINKKSGLHFYFPWCHFCQTIINIFSSAHTKRAAVCSKSPSGENWKQKPQMLTSAERIYKSKHLQRKTWGRPHLKLIYLKVTDFWSAGREGGERRLNDVSVCEPFWWFHLFLPCIWHCSDIQ